MKAALTLFAVAALSHAQELEFGDREEVEVDRGDVDMTLAWDIAHGSKSMLLRSVDLWAVNIYATLSGDLEEGDWYQTYVSFPSWSEPGNYETFTCASEYGSDVG